MCTNSIRCRMTPVLGTSCGLTKQKEYFMVPEELKLILVICHKSRLHDLHINDVTLIFMRPLSHNRRRKQHQKPVYYVPTGLVAQLHSWIRVVDVHGRGCFIRREGWWGTGEGGLCEDLARFVLSARGMGGAIEYIHNRGATGLMRQTCMLDRGFSWGTVPYCCHGLENHTKLLSRASRSYETIVTGYKIIRNYCHGLQDHTKLLSRASRSYETIVTGLKIIRNYCHGLQDHTKLKSRASRSYETIVTDFKIIRNYCHGLQDHTKLLSRAWRSNETIVTGLKIIRN